MTIFDTLRHPVNDNMPVEEFQAIPLEIRQAWVNHKDFINRYVDNKRILEAYAEQNMILLRRIIAEWP